MARRSTRSRADRLERADIVSTFGANLKAARMKIGLSQTDLAQAAGLLQQYVSLVESGKQNITLITAVALANAVDQDVTALLARPRPRLVKR
jgi:transcriptional regulator with XRE-family HTH domain